MGRTDTRSVVPVRHRHDGAVEERDSGGPGQRALSAMAEAVRRAREMTEPANGGSRGSPPPAVEISRLNAGSTSTLEPAQSQSEPTLVPAESGIEPTLVPGEIRPEPTRLYPPVVRLRVTAKKTERVGPPRPPPTTKNPFRWAVVVVGVVVVILSAVVVVVNMKSHAPVSSPTPPRVAPARPTTSPTKASSATTTTAPTTTMTAPRITTPSTPTAGGPELTSLTPAEGSAGQSVVISGANFFSADGYIQAFFGGQEAPTSCPGQTSCTVVVPVLSGPPRGVQVTVTTESGTSNAVSFYYS